MNPNQDLVNALRAAPKLDEYGRPLCARCGELVDTTHPGHYSITVGWAQSRSEGGAHGISHRRDVGLWKHKLCWQKDELGGQEELF